MAWWTQLQQTTQAVTQRALTAVSAVGSIDLDVLHQEGEPSKADAKLGPNPQSDLDVFVTHSEERTPGFAFDSRCAAAQWRCSLMDIV